MGNIPQLVNLLAIPLDGTGDLSVLKSIAWALLVLEGEKQSQRDQGGNKYLDALRKDSFQLAEKLIIYKIIVVNIYCIKQLCLRPLHLLIY